MIGIIMMTMAVSAADVKAAIGIDPAMCRVVRISADGRRTEQPPSRAYSRPSSNSVRVRSGGAGSSSSSVSVSSASSSQGSGSGTSRAEVDGRIITATYDNKGCAIVIEQR